MGGDEKRKHRSTGKPRGGKREGSGRTPGPNLLEYGESSAIRAMKLRLPPDASPAATELAGEAFETLVKVMRGEVDPEMAAHRRNAAKDVREEICKPIPKQVNLADADGEKITINILSLADAED